MQNNNQKVIRRLSKKSFKSNIMRNVFAIASIALTCLLFTCLFSIGITMNGNMEKERMRQVGTSAHAGLKDLSSEQWEILKRHPLIRKTCTNILLGNTTSEKLLKRQGEIRSIGEGDFLKTSFIELTEGKSPEKEKEILLDTITLDLLGIPYKLGETVPLSFDFMGKEYTENFTLCGYYQGDPIIGASQIFISKEYWEEISKGFTEQEFKEANFSALSSGTGLIQSSVWFKNSKNIEENVKKVITDSGFETGTTTIDSIDYGVNWAYTYESLDGIDMPTVAIMVVLLAVILLTGYLIIYNIFQISVVNDIRYYGLLKTIGATKKQLRRLIRNQVLYLSAVGIPIGLIMGYLLGKILIPVIINSMTDMKIQQVEFNPFIFIFGIIFSSITVLISCRKPAKIAGNVSPIEAVRYIENTLPLKKHNKEKVTQHGGKIWRLAWSNLGRSKKKTMVVVASISLSVVLLTEIVTLIQGFSIDKYLDQMLNGDFMIASADYFRNRGGELSEDLKKQALAQPGIENYTELYANYINYGHVADDICKTAYQKAYDSGELEIKPMFQNYFNAILKKEAGMSETRYGFDEQALDKLKVLEGTINKEKFMTGKYVLIADGVETSIYKPGDKINLSVYSKNSKQVYNEETFDYEKGFPKLSIWENITQKEYEVMAVVDIPSGMGVRSYPIFGFFSILPVQEFLDVTQIYDVEGNKSNPSYGLLVNVEDTKEAAFRDFLDNYTTKVDPSTQYESKEAIRGEFDGMISMIAAVGGGLAAVVAIIGILNFINSTFTSVITRKREFALLQSIGMNGSQLMQMLLLESVYYILAASVISIIIGSLLSSLLIQSFNTILAFFDYSFTWMPFIYTIPAFLLIAVLVPVFAYYSVRKQSIVERLH